MLFFTTTFFSVTFFFFWCGLYTLSSDSVSSIVPTMTSFEFPVSESFREKILSPFWAQNLKNCSKMAIFGNFTLVLHRHICYYKIQNNLTKNFVFKSCITHYNADKMYSIFAPSNLKLTDPTLFFVVVFLLFYLREMSQWHLPTTYAHNTAMLAGEDNLCILLS